MLHWTGYGHDINSKTKTIHTQTHTLRLYEQGDEVALTESQIYIKGIR